MRARAWARAAYGFVLLALAALLAMVLSPAPGAAQTTSAPPKPVKITSVDPPCWPLGKSVQIDVSGTAEPSNGGVITLTDPRGTQLDSRDWTDGGTGKWTSALLPFTPTINGYYLIHIYDNRGTTADAYFSAPCRNPHVTLDPPCFTPGQPVSLTVSAFDFAPNNTGYATYDPSGSDQQTRIRIPIDAAGNWATSAAYKSAPFAVTPANRSYPIHANDLRNNVVDTSWLPCPPPATTTVPEETTVPEITVTTRPGVTTLPLVTTTSTVPPTTIGATLTIFPNVGQPGAVCLASGTGFPPGPVVLSWLPGIGLTPATAGPDGKFSVRVLVFPRDRLGPRSLVATGGATTASAQFLVVPNTTKPSGKDVTQITRIRRLIER